MTDDQLANLWPFSRGETSGITFEQWFLQQSELEKELGEELHFELLSADYRDREQVRKLRMALNDYLTPFRECECPTIRDGSAIPMGGDFYFEKVFEPLQEIVRYGPDKWWLYVSRCSRCRTNWLVAQDERVYDDFFMQRLTNAEVEQAKSGQWPARFQTYEDVLSVGREVSNPPRFMDPMAASLIWTMQDLLSERPEMSTKQIAYLLGLGNDHAEKLVQRVRAESK
jgi:hypothetical protein